MRWHDALVHPLKQIIFSQRLTASDPALRPLRLLALRSYMTSDLSAFLQESGRAGVEYSRLLNLIPINRTYHSIPLVLPDEKKQGR